MIPLTEMTMNRLVQRSLEATEIWFLIRMSKVPWSANITNKESLTKTSGKKKSIKFIRKRRITFTGHMMRKDRLENITTGKINRKRNR